MRKLTTTLCLTIAVLLGSAGMSSGADFRKGLDAAQRGDFNTALEEWEPLARLGDAFAQYNLGQMYRRAQGVPQDYETAVKWYRLASEQGIADAQHNLGVRYAKGEGVTRDDKTAVKFFTLAAKQGYAVSQFYLGWMYDKGRGVTQDNVRAHMWLNIAALLGNKTASENRDLIAERMTPSQIEIAQELARECVRREYKVC